MNLIYTIKGQKAVCERFKLSIVESRRNNEVNLTYHDYDFKINFKN